MTPERKKICQLSGDIISNLPRHAIDEILTRLPSREAARTCILSRRWRYMWANLPYLEVDRNTFTETKKKTEERLVIAIQEVVLLKRVPIVKFVLSLPGLKSSRHIDLLVSFFSRICGFQELTLSFLESDKDYKLPPSLFSCTELTRLSLTHCAIEPPIQFKGFNKLISMELCQCSIRPDVLSDLISSCPLLEELKVTGNTLLNGHIEVSAPNLRDLIITDYFQLIFSWYQTGSNCGMGRYKSLLYNNSLPRKLATSLNNLKSLTLGWISFALLYEVSLVLCLIRSSPNLTKIVVETVEQGGTDDGDVEEITRLLEVQEWSETSLNSLREAEVHRITGKVPELGFVKLLLAISPKLETIIVSPRSWGVTPQQRLEISAKLTRLRRPSPLTEIIYKY